MGTTVALGADLHVGDTIEAIDGPHTIDHFGEYPGRFVGDTARRAFYDRDETCGCTVADHKQFHIQSQEGSAVTSHLHNTLILRVKDALADIESHDHANAPLSDIYCLNLKAWLGDQMPGILRILSNAQAEINSLRAREMALADHAVELLDSDRDEED